MSVDKVSLPTKLSYGFGQLAEGVKNAAFLTFLLLYYNQVLGLSGSLAGLAIFIALCFDAVTDPIAGSISDNFKSKWGRRHPFLYASVIPLALAFYFLFAPPGDLSSFSLFIWMTTLTILTRGAMTLYYVPHLALGAELSGHYTERTSIVAYRQVFSVVGSLGVIILGFSFFFRDVGDQSGDLIAANYPPFALALAIAMVISILVSAGGTHAQIPNLPKTHFVARPGIGATLLGVFADTTEALKNSSFKWLAGATLSIFVMVGVQTSLALYMANFFWQLDAQSKMLLLISIPAGFFLGIAFTRKLHERFDKSRTMIAGATLYCMFAVLPIVLRLLGWFPENSSDILMPVLVLFGVASGLCGVQSLVTGSSMMADVADEHELKTGRRQEGIFFGAISFANKAASGVGGMIAGLALDLIGFPVGTIPGAVPQEIVFNLGAVFGPTVMVFAVMAVWCLTHYKLTQTKHEEINQLLRERHADAALIGAERVAVDRTLPDRGFSSSTSPN